MSPQTVAPPTVEVAEADEPKMLAALKTQINGVTVFTPSDDPGAYHERSVQYGVLRDMAKQVPHMKGMRNRVFLILPSAEKIDSLEGGVALDVQKAIDGIFEIQPYARVGLCLCLVKKMQKGLLDYLETKRLEVIDECGPDGEVAELVLLGISESVGDMIRRENRRENFCFYPSVPIAFANALLVE